ncbi:MAG: endonuclease domain-containing protein [Bacteroidales bacterium]|nr:endonuclease domain-containing protein [Bacteroidales bacterium]
MSISNNVTMFCNAKPHVFEKAKMLRENMTASEKLLWEHLKGKKMLNLRFRPQHPIDRFIADFYCHPLKLVIEVDGGIHKSRDQKEYDINREAELNSWGIKIIRFTNEEVEHNTAIVISEIERVCVEIKAG